VARDEQWPLAAVALHARHEVGAVGLEGEHLHRNPLGRQHLLQVVDDRGLLAGRIAGVDAQNRLEVLERLAFESGPVGNRHEARLRRQTHLEGHGAGEGNESGSKQSTHGIRTAS